MDDRAIGVISSGVGGLTVLDALHSALPHEKFVFIGDNLRTPYGNKSEDEIIDFALQLAGWIEKQNIKTMIVASNTLSSIALPAIKSRSKLPVFGMVEAEVETVMMWENLMGEDLKHIGVLGTKNTIVSRVHENSLRTAGFMGEISAVSCALFMPLLKEGIMDAVVWNAMIGYYCSSLRDRHVDGVLIASSGCTLVHEYLQEYFVGKTQIFNPNSMLVKMVNEYMLQHELVAEENVQARVDLYTTGALPVFEFFAQRFFDFKVNKINVVNLSELLN